MTMIADAIVRLTRTHLERPAPGDDFWYRNPPGLPTSSGIQVTCDNGLRVSAVFACVRVLAETFASLPCRLYERMDGERKRQARDHWLWPVLHDQPNPWQTSFEWREMGMAHLALRGNFYNRIWQSPDRVSLIPLNPDRVRPEQVSTQRIVYHWRPPSGAEEIIEADRMFHVRGLSLDGLTGISILDYARNSIGLSIAQETHGASQFRNGALPAFWIKRPKESGKWTPDARINFRSAWRAVHAGPENAGNPPILEEGMSLEELGLTNEDSQWIESRGFQVVEICRFFRVPPHLVAELTRATFSNIEQQSLEFVIYTMAPWAIRFEQAAGRDLLDATDPFFVKLVLDGLVRGDIATRYAAYNTGIQAGFLTRNEVRALEDLDPIDGGDEALRPLNMAPASGDAGEETGRQTEAEEALEPFLRDAASRIAAAEIRGLQSRIAKAATDLDRWRSWVEAFYAEHAGYAAKVLGPLADAWTTMTGNPVSAHAVANAITIRARQIMQETDDPAAAFARSRLDRDQTLFRALQGAFHVVPENPR
jgi:HK97 family phage portal protein